MGDRRIEVAIEDWPINGSFVISRGAKTHATVVVATLHEAGMSGRGECVPYPRYGQTPDETARTMADAKSHIGDRSILMSAMAPSAARNALDCALWDLEAKLAGKTVCDLLRLAPLNPILTCYTISLDRPEAMAHEAALRADLPLLKLKLGGAGGDADRMRAVRQARPDARLVGDANEGWAEADVPFLLGVAAEAGFELIEQPLPADRDELLAHIVHPVTVCADESAHSADGLTALADRYDAVNIKLDKTGGLTGALDMLAEAQRLHLDVMVGCMVSTSLSMAPALFVAQQARWADLDGPLLLARDRDPGVKIERGVVSPPPSALWG